MLERLVVRPSFDSLTRISQHKRVGHFAGESFDITITPGIAAAGLRLPGASILGVAYGSGLLVLSPAGDRGSMGGEASHHRQREGAS